MTEAAPAAAAAPLSPKPTIAPQYQTSSEPTTKISLFDSPAEVAKEIAAPVAATPGIEVPKEEPRPDTHELSNKFAALAKKERELFKRQQELKEITSKAEKYEAMRKKAKENPLDYLKEAELDYDTVTKFILNDQKPTEAQEVASVRSEIAALKEQLQKEKEESEKIKQSNRVAHFKGELSQHIATNQNKFPLVNALKGMEVVYNVIETHWNSTYDPVTEKGDLLSHDQAAELTEKYYKSQIADSLKSPELKNHIIQELGLNPTTEDSPKPTSHFTQAERPKTNISPTLTNALAQEVPDRMDRPMSEQERIKNAARLLRWNAD